MPRDGLKAGGLQWRKARRSANNGACVEVTPANGHVFVRDSQNQDGPVVPYAGIAWRAFLAGARAGRFDLDRL
jgi:uncharacterized protein DUF397